MFSIGKTALVYPQQPPPGEHLHRPTAIGLHQTAGIPGNWALDFMAPGGTRVLAVEAALVSRFSGHDPQLGEVAPGIYGWNIYLTCGDGREWFYTHLSNRDDRVLGRHVDAGTILGHVGQWPHDPPRSHTHLGVTNHLGAAASKATVVRASTAPIVTGHWHK